VRGDCTILEVTLKEYHSNAMFEMLHSALLRNTVYQRLLFEQGQLGRPLEEKEISKIWEDGCKDLNEETANFDELEKIYGDDAWK